MTEHLQVSLSPVSAILIILQEVQQTSRNPGLASSPSLPPLVAISGAVYGMLLFAYPWPTQGHCRAPSSKFSLIKHCTLVGSFAWPKHCMA